MDTAIWVILIVVALAVGAGAAWFLLQRRRSTHLRSQFGPEYDRTVKTLGNEGKAQAELERREKRVKHLELRSLSREEASEFGERWRLVQAKFVDHPEAAVDEADDLLTEVMRARGYPVADFEQRAADLSVEHGRFVDDYRAARDIVDRRKSGNASTEDLRQAMVHYRSLFQDLLQNDSSIRLEETR
jgi:hypothetical protein